MNKIKQALLIATVTTGAAALVFAFLSSDKEIKGPVADTDEVDADHFSSEEQESLTNELNQML